MWDQLTTSQRAYKLAYRLTLDKVGLKGVERIGHYRRWKYTTERGYIVVTDESLLHDLEDSLVDYISARLRGLQANQFVCLEYDIR